MNRLSSDESPHGGRWVTLGDICEIKRGEYLTRKEIGDGDIPVIAGGQTPAYYHNQANRTGEVITVSGSGAYAGFVNFFDHPIFASDCSTLQVKAANVLMKYVYLAMKSRQSDIYALRIGSAQPHVYAKDVAKIKISLPSIAEQKRIVAVLNEQMAAAEKARMAALEKVEAVRALASAWLQEVFSFGGGDLPQGWQWRTLNNVCIEERHVVDGKSDDIGALPYLSLENIESMSGKIVLHKNSDSNIQGISNCFRFGPEHVLYGKLRPYLNKVALPDFAGRCTTEAIPILPKSEIDREFLAWTLRRRETVNWAMAEKTGSRMPRTNMKHLMSFKFPLPPLTDQKRLISALKGKIAAAEKARVAAEAELEDITALPSALLRQAFSGAL